MYLEEAEKLSEYCKAYNGLLGIKLVRVNTKRICRVCGKDIQTGTEAYTCGMPKIQGRTFKYFVDNKIQCNSKNFKICRQWICIDCFKKLRIVHKEYNEACILESDIYKKYSYEKQLSIAEKLYKEGKISAKEMQEIEDDSISAIAYRDATADDF